MRLVPCNDSEIKGFKPTSNFKILNEFAESDMTCAAVEEHNCKSAESCASSLNISIKRFKMVGLRAFSRKGKVYLMKTSEFER